MEDKKMTNIYLTNLGKYNEGILIGEWLALPATEEEIEETKKRIGINKHYEEFFITDYECDYMEIGEFDNLKELNEKAEFFEKLYYKNIFKALCNYYGFEEAKELMLSGDYSVWNNCTTATEVAELYVEENYQIPENLRCYFDYEALGRDIEIEYTLIPTEDGDMIQVFV